MNRLECCFLWLIWKKIDVNLCYVIMTCMIQARNNDIVPYGMLLTRLFRHLKNEEGRKFHEKSIIRKNFVRKEGGEEGSKRVDIEAPFTEIENELEIGYKFKSEEEAKSVNSGNGSDSSLDTMLCKSE